MPVTHKPRPSVVAGKSVPAAVGGLNAYNGLPAMPEQDAIIMRNLIPAPYGCPVRKGYQLFADGFAEGVGTVMAWRSDDGSAKLFAVDADHIYNATDGGTMTAAEQVVASQNPWWQSTNFANAAGVHLIAFNGIDDGFWWGPAGYAPLVVGDGTANGTWKNVDPKDLVNVVVHQKRIWAVEKDSNLGWYLPPEQVYGVATSFDFGGCFSKGGFLQALATWTTDSGTGIDDKLLAISSQGEVAIYSGFDPNDPDNWKLEGVYNAGETFTRRCWTKYGGDCAILTQYGVVTMSSLLSAEESVSANSLSLKVQKVFSDLAAEGEYRAGWQILNYPNEDLLIVNIPGLSISANFQLAMNTITRGWTEFVGFSAQCWSRYGSSIVYGGFQALYIGLIGRTDNADMEGENGVAIRAEVQQAFSYFGAQGQNKHFKMFRPTFIYGGDFEFRAQANMDFDFGGTPPAASPPFYKYGIWDEDVWDGGAVWSGGLLSAKQWVFVTGIGYAASIRMQIETASEVTWVSTDWAMENGGIV
jgi:hypothetical protein